MADEKLTTKQRLFVEFYVGAAHGNATEAARLSGYAGNDITLGAVGAENLKKPQIARLCQLRVAQAALSADKVLSELSDIALSKDESTRDRLTALQLLGKYHKLFNEKLDVSLDVRDWRTEIKKYGISEAEVVAQTKLFLAEYDAGTSSEESN